MLAYGQLRPRMFCSYARNVRALAAGRRQPVRRRRVRTEVARKGSDEVRTVFPEGPRGGSWNDKLPVRGYALRDGYLRQLDH